MKQFRFSVKAIILGLVLVFVSGNGVWAEEKKSYSLLSAAFGTSGYVMCTALEKITQEHNASFALSHSETPNPIYNIMKLEKQPEEKKTTVFVSAPDLIWLARAGKSAFKKPMGQDIRTIGNFNIGGRWFVANDPNIKELADLKGKKIGLGNKKSPGWALAPVWDLTIGGGVKPEEVTLEYLGLKASATAYKDGLIDAMIAGGYINPVSGLVVPAPFFVELLAAAGDVHYVNTGEDALKRVQAKVGLPTRPHVLKPGGIKGLDREITIGTSAITWNVYKEFPEDAAYELTKILIEHTDEFDKYHALGKLLTKEMLCWSLDPEELHPGAYRAYKEAGLMK